MTCAGAISNLTVNAGYKATTLMVYGSTDGENWEEVGSITTSSSYKDYTLDIDESAGYTYLKLDPTGGKQLRIASLGVSMMVEG